MKRPPILFLPLLFACSLSFYSYGQDKVFAEGEAFVQDAGSGAAIFRGRQATRYNILYEGTYFWDSPDFKTGSVVWDGKRYDGLTLNIDAVTQEALVYPPGSSTAVVMDRDHIDKLEIDGTSYVNLSKMGYPVQKGFYEVCHIGEEGTVYRQLNKTPNINLSNAEHTRHATYYFNISESFFLEHDGILELLRRRRASRLLRDPRDRSFASAIKRGESVTKRQTGAQDDLLLPEELRAGPGKTYSTPLSDFSIDGKDIYTSLPQDFFSTGTKTADDELLRLLNAGNEIVTFANKVYEVGQAENANGDRAYVHGTVRDILSGEPLVGVIVSGGSSYATTDNDGGFRLSLPLGDNVLYFSGF